MKRIFEIEFPDNHGPVWMNRDNLLHCLTNTCRDTTFVVRDITGDIPPDSEAAEARIGNSGKPRDVKEQFEAYYESMYGFLPDMRNPWVADEFKAFRAGFERAS